MTRKADVNVSVGDNAPPKEVVNTIATMLSDDFRSQHLVPKLAAIMGAVGYIPKRGYNDFHKYKYVMEADLVATIRPLLAAAGIMIIPDVVEEHLEVGVIEERSGKSHLSRVKVAYTVTDGRDSLTFAIPGYGVDKGDKSVYKALTGSMKYALMKLFEVETGDDPERETSVIDDSITITRSDETVGKGGHTEKASRYQLQRISATMRDRGIPRSVLLSIIDDLFQVELQVPDDDAQASRVIAAYLTDLDSPDAGALLDRLEAQEAPVA